MNQHYLQLYADFYRQGGRQCAPAPEFHCSLPGHDARTLPTPVSAQATRPSAKTVVVRWEDDKLTRLQMEMAAESDLCAMKPYELRSYLAAEDPDGCCTLAIHAADPEALAAWMPAS